jgi:uncharacterized repeat protein (TIGR03803 family)
VFELTPAGGGSWTEKVLYSFGAYGTDGVVPYAGLIFDAAGNLYGTTYAGGTYYQYGTVFELTPAAGGGWTEKVLHNFVANGTDGYYPWAGLAFDRFGNLYGTTSTGGTYEGGIVFELTPAGSGGWTETVLHRFGNAMDGSGPLAGLIFDAAGNLYGTTSGGGTYDGTVFELTPAGGGSWTEKVLWSFGSGTDGFAPQVGLVFDAAGNLYGTTPWGGTNGYGTVFELTPAGSGGWTEAVLHNFNEFGNGDGYYPLAALILDAAGNLYGTTSVGGTYNNGTVFELQLPPTLTVSTSGDGTVTSTDGFIICPGTCSHTYPEGTPVTLNATPGQGWVFGGWNGACLGTGSCAVTMTQPLSVDAIFSQAQQFVAATPCRLIDTRLTGGPIQGGTSRSFPIPQEGGCNIPTTAAAYSLNVSAVPQGSLAYLTIWPTGESRPVVATLNSLDGRIKADAAIVPAGTSGAVSVYVTNTSNVVLDINGYFAPVSGSTLAFYPLTPCRIADTRKTNFPQGLGAPFLPGQQERDFPILNATSCNIPASAAAYSLNFSVVPHGGLGYMTVWPTGQPRPLVSTLNDVPGTIIANAAIVPAGTSGKVSVYPSNDTDVIIDINGYFAPAGPGGLSLYPAAPCRVIDTRHVGNGQPFSGTLSPPVDVVHSPCEPPVTAQAYVFNATVVPTGALGYLTLWPDGQPKPLVSTLNALDGSITNNMAIVPSTNGKVDAFASGITQLILDISSYFAP